MTWERVPTIALRDSQPPLVLVGLPGTGKTTQARFLAQALGVQAIDTDTETRWRAHMTIPEIFTVEGEKNFRDCEYRVMWAVLDSPVTTQGVIALGGGVALRLENRNLLHGHTAIYLSASSSAVAKHAGDGAGRPVMALDAGSDQARAAQQHCEEQGEHAGVLARIEVLHARRSPLYSEVATLTILTDGSNPQQVAVFILAVLGAQTSQAAGVLAPMAEAQMDSPAAPDGAEASLRRVRVRPAVTTEGSGGTRGAVVGGQSPYDVLIGYGILAEPPCIMQDTPGADMGGITAIRAKTLSDRVCAAEVTLTVEGLRVLRLEIPDGEAAKRIRVAEYLWGRLGSSRLGHDGLVIGFGGGATTDLVDFTAATRLRGIPVVQTSTTLLAMADTAAGGGMGIDTPVGKSLVGTFHSPVAVIADLEMLSTLLAAELWAGFGEIIKCDLIADSVILDRVLADPADYLTWDSPVLADLVTRSIAVKAAVMGKDLTEAGLWKVLNYGRTYAHTIGKVIDYSRRYGEAVAIGCVLVAKIAHRNDSLSSDALALHHQSLETVGLLTRFPEGGGRWEELKETMMSDKKMRDGWLHLVLFGDIVEPVRAQAPTESILLPTHETATGGAGRTEGNRG